MDFEIVLSIVGAVVLLFVLVAVGLLLALRGRTGHADWKILGAKPYAHRGLHDAEKPENSLAAFKAAAKAGLGAEMDVHLLSDGTLAVFHDSELLRMTGKEGIIEELTAENLCEYHLQGTDETIPTFDEVLDVFKNGEPLVVELKNYKGNASALCKAVCERLDSYKGVYCIECFDPRCVLWLKKNRPEIVRGFLSQRPKKYDKNLSGIVKFLIGNLLLNFLIKPDFVAYDFDGRNSLPFKLCTRVLGVKGILWTITDSKQYSEAVKDGCFGIFEGFIPKEKCE